MAENINTIPCPIMKKVIDAGYCDEIQGIADGFYKPTDDEEHLSKDDYAICKGCEMRDSLWGKKRNNAID